MTPEPARAATLDTRELDATQEYIAALREEFAKIFDAAQEALECLENGEVDTTINVVRYIKLKAMEHAPNRELAAPRPGDGDPAGE